MKKLNNMKKLWLLINIICFLILFIYAFYIALFEKKYNEATFLLALCILGKPMLDEDMKKLKQKN